IQAYFEWLPVRAASPAEMRKKVSIGKDVELYLLDERMSGRTKQLKAEHPDFNSPERSLLGTRQRQWLEDELRRSKSTWKLIGNQVMFTGYTAPEGDKRPSYNDWWVGYPYERNRLIDLLGQQHVSNV